MHTEEEHVYFESIAVKGAVLFLKYKNEDEDSFISILTKEFGDNLVARMIYSFLPIAFGWALLKKMGVESFPSYFKLLDKNDAEVEFKMSEQGIFMGGLSIAFKVFEHGYTEILTKEVVAEVIIHSAEVNAANSALNSGEELKGSKILPTTIYSIKAEEMAGVSS